MFQSTPVTGRQRRSEELTPLPDVIIPLPGELSNLSRFSMNVIALKPLREFWEQHPDAEQPLKAWLDEARRALWTQPADIKARYKNASILKNRRVVFNIKGNDYRLVVAVAYRFRAVYIKFIGTHRDYDLIDAETIDMGA